MESKLEKAIVDGAAVGFALGYGWVTVKFVVFMISNGGL